MTWAEFCIRLFAYKRIDKNNWFKLRELMWVSLIGSHINPKKLPRSKERFMPLEPKKEIHITDDMRQRMYQATIEYNKQKAKNNG